MLPGSYNPRAGIMADEAALAAEEQRVVAMDPADDPGEDYDVPPPLADDDGSGYDPLPPPNPS